MTTLTLTTWNRDQVEIWSRTLPQAQALPSEPVDSRRFQLLDHILFTQALVGDAASPRVQFHAGRVEHTIHQRINVPLTKTNHSSDHTPVSVEISL